MSSYYQQSCELESQGLSILVPFIAHVSKKVVEPITDAIEQQQLGDLRVESKIIEVKVERRFTGNLFLEEYSNREWHRLGWLHTCQANRIVFYFLDRDMMYCMSLKALRHWCFNKQSPNIDRFRRVPVKQDQRNDTWGVLVPIAELREAKLDAWYEASPLAVMANIDAD